MVKGIFHLMAGRSRGRGFSFLDARKGMMPVSVVSPAAKNRTIIVLVGGGVCQWSA